MACVGVAAGAVAGSKATDSGSDTLNLDNLDIEEDVNEPPIFEEYESERNTATDSV